MGKQNEFKFGVSSAIYDLIWQGVRCNLKKDTVINTLGEVVVSRLIIGICEVHSECTYL